MATENDQNETSPIQTKKELKGKRRFRENWTEKFPWVSKDPGGFMY